jgi:hypothetical protein
MLGRPTHASRSNIAYYSEILGGALFNKVKATDWTTTVQSDGIRIGADLPDLGRFGVLMANDGQWGATQVVPRWFVTQMSQRQTTGIPPDYTGDVVMDPAQFPNSPYSLLTWTRHGDSTATGAFTRRISA